MVFGLSSWNFDWSLNFLIFSVVHIWWNRQVNVKKIWKLPNFLLFRVDSQHGYCRNQTLYFALRTQVSHTLAECVLHLFKLEYANHLCWLSLDYIQAVSDWLAVLLTKIRPWLYINGGNIITVQVVHYVISYDLFLVVFLPMNLFFNSRWRMNTEAISPVTTTTCVTCTLCFTSFWVNRQCCSPQMETQTRRWHVGLWRDYMPQWTLEQVLHKKKNSKAASPIFLHHSGII